MSTTLEQVAARVALLEAQMAEMMTKQEVDKPKKEKKEKSEEPKKKRGVSGYLVFAKETRASSKQALIDGGNETPKPTEVLTQVAKQWRELGDEAKGEWNEKAKATSFHGQNFLYHFARVQHSISVAKWKKNSVSKSAIVTPFQL